MASRTTSLLLLLSLFAVPQAFLLLLALSLALAYRHIKTSPPTYRARLIKLHAFATESVQLTLALVGWANILAVAVLLFSPADLIQGDDHSHHQHDQRKIDFLQLIGSSLILFIACVGAVLSVYAVDLIEARVVLGVWRHPYAWRCFALTRALLWTVWREKRNLPSSSGPGVKVIVHGERRDAENGLRGLEYLDLAWRRGKVERERERERSWSLEYLDLDFGSKERRRSKRMSLPWS